MQRLRPALCLPAVVLLGASSASEAASFDAAGEPYRIARDGTVDWATFEGYRRFNGNCETCHGFDGLGSAFAPSLVESLQRMSHDQFIAIVMHGKQDVNAAQSLKMPAYDTNPNVMCYIEDIYAYLKARADGVLGRGRPRKHEPKPAAATRAEDACMR